MRKMLFLLLTALMVFSVSSLFSQTVKVRGTVVSSANEAVPNATVTVKGTNRATQTDARGNFTIEATRGEVLVLTSVSFLAKEFTVGDNASPRISLSLAEGTLGEVVVTALDIKRNPRE